VISTCVLPSSEACFWGYFKDSLVCIRQFCGRYLTVAEVSLSMTVRKFLPRWNELLLILSIWSVTMVHLVSRAIVMWFNFCSNSQPPFSQNTHAQKVMSHYNSHCTRSKQCKIKTYSLPKHCTQVEFAGHPPRTCISKHGTRVFEGSLRPALQKINRRLVPNRKLSLEQNFHVLKHICFMMNTKILFWMNHLYEHLKTFFCNVKWG